MADLRIDRVDPRAWETLVAVSRIDREAFGEEGLTPSNCCLIAQSGMVYALSEHGQVLGEALVLGGLPEPPAGETLAACPPERGAGAPRAFLFSLAITGAARQRGLGARLMLRVISDLAASSVRWLELTVDPANLPAVGLYEGKLGFVRVELIPDFLGPGRPRLLLRREIP